MIALVLKTLILFQLVAFADASKTTTVLSTISSVKSPLDMTSISGDVVPTCANDSFGTSRTVQVKMVFSCFPTNLRYVENPLAFGSMMRITLKLSPSAGGQEVRFEVPYDVTIPDFGGNPIGTYQAPANMTANLTDVERFRNIVRFKVTGVTTPSVTPGGDIDRSELVKTIDRVEAYQFLAPGALPGPFVGHEGVLTTEVEKQVSADACTHIINVRVPGATKPGQVAYWVAGSTEGFCGAWYSPLMIFFDDQLPKFTGISKFQLSSFDQETYWVEKDAPGYFLAHDRNQNKKIDDGTELFGDGQYGSNGFEALNIHDKNKDGVIDEKDAIFSKLILWKDKNGDGISQASEMKSLADLNITSINLKYKHQRQDFGKRAHYRQASDFTFTKNGKSLKGRVLDMWFTSPQATFMTKSK